MLQLFNVILEYSSHLLGCLNDSHCHDAFPVCDNDAHQCVGKDIILSYRMKSNTFVIIRALILIIVGLLL